ncbi:undecaprenyldiphospho-muramoylpentapeptide beta-N-acetylglucosaminyltransferase [Algivirga pacifica]|uniref:UDP-N-acetylglucosamine--N-acetylmuramyl-(pentapeptide) pyrophosphoryl-undecaprenol N-acetylglucosamine transferase n=1 Tax=Algivirga pacifica TaxID=1162670 RepID=A0ABP9CZS0_9BACT
MGKRIIISGGGTGGHVYPAIAIADALKQADATTEILFVGAEGKMEMDKVPEAGYPIEGLWISGIQRRLTMDNLMFPFKLISSIWKAFSIIRQFKPDAVVGVGGYASGPIMYAANQAGIPTLIQEQNGYAGLTNKLLASKASAICVAYPDMQKYFPEDRIHFTGNPVRKDITELEKLREEAFDHFGLSSSRKTVLVIGGSLGALTVNESIAKNVDTLLEKGYQLIWQTGKYYSDRFQQEFAHREPEGLKVMPFIRRMDYAYACADVVVSRAGALSISELCLTGKPSILIPSPNVAEDHQTKNALALEKEEAAVMVKDTAAREQLGEVLMRLLEDEQQQKQLQQAILKLAKPKAAQEIAEVIIQLPTK